MTIKDKKIIADSNSELGSHTDNHPTNLPALYYFNNGDFNRQIAGSKENLENLTGKAIYTFAYPYGNTGGDPNVLAEISQHYYAAFTTVPGNLHYLSRSNILPRIGVN